MSEQPSERIEYRSPEVRHDMLRESFRLQEDLQSNAYGTGISPRDFSDGGRIEFIKTNILALTDELHEALAEVGWKPWATSRHINEEALQGELVDAFHFFMNLRIVARLDADMLFLAYQAKRTKNIKRQVDGYDGVGGKCPICHRALDDDAVKCGPGTEGWFCAGRVDVDAI